jgi:hypothetical protein
MSIWKDAVRKYGQGLNAGIEMTTDMSGIGQQALERLLGDCAEKCEKLTAGAPGCCKNINDK